MLHLLAALALLAGCATYEPKPLVLENSATTLDARRLDTPELRKFIEQHLGHELKAWPPDSQAPGWTLPTLTLTAYYYHPALEVARASWAEARAALITAGGRPNPTLGLTPGYNFSAASGVTPWTPGATLDLPIETAGKRGHRIAHARQLAEAARWNLVTAAWQVRAGVRDALLNFSDAMQREQLLGEQFKLQEQWVARLQQRADAGAIPRSEVTPAKVALEKLRLEAADLHRLMGENTVRLAEAIGVPVASLNQAKGIGLAWHFPDATNLTEATARRNALTRRADIAAALADYEAAQAALQLEIAKQYPDVHLGTGYQWDQGDSKWNLGLNVELPVFNRNQGPIAEAHARRASAAARVEAAQARAIAEIDAALAAHRAAHGRLGSVELLAAEQKKQADDFEAQARAGALDGVDLLGTKIELAQFRLVQWDAGVKAMQALGRLEDALQTPLESNHSARAPGGFIEANPRAAKKKP